MKKIISVVLAGMIVCGAASAQSIKVVNTFGGDSDSTGGSDLFTFENQKNGYGTNKNQFDNTTRVSDRLQLDVSDEKYDARVRLEFGATKLNGKESTVRFRGYGRFKPISQFQLIAGNDMFTKVAVDAGYLVASDDYPKYARILQSGFGAISNWTFGNEKNVYANFATGIKGTDNSFLDVNKLGFDAGVNFGIKKIFNAGASFQNMTGNKFSAAIFAGLNCVDNLTLNVGYIFNDTDTDFIAKEVKNAISATVGYNFKDIGLSLGADVVAGVGNEYLDKGVTKTYLKDGNAVTPFFAKMNVSYKVTDTVSIGAKAKVSMMLGDNHSVKSEIYPNVSYTLSGKLGTLTSGVRFTLDKDGLTKFAIPLSWKCTLADIKK